LKSKIIINGKVVDKRLIDDDLVEELDAPYSAEFLKGEDGVLELLSVNSEYLPTVEEVVTELEEAGLEETGPIEVFIVGAESLEELLEAVSSNDELNGGDNVELLEEALGESGSGGESTDEEYEEEPTVEDADEEPVEDAEGEYKYKPGSVEYTKKGDWVIQYKGKTVYRGKDQAKAERLLKEFNEDEDQDKKTDSIPIRRGRR
jgi:hypothetical protein